MFVWYYLYTLASVSLPLWIGRDKPVDVTNKAVKSMVLTQGEYKANLSGTLALIIKFSL
jgi:hypothetical protein